MERYFGEIRQVWKRKKSETKVKCRYHRKGGDMSEINDWILCYIDEHIEEELTVTGIAEEAGYSPRRTM